MFGVTDTYRDGGQWARDFIDNYTTAVAQVMRRCRAEFLGFTGGTDGGESGLFQIRGDAQEAVACIERHLPQGRVLNVERTPRSNNS
jgi:hypothetical protein